MPTYRLSDILVIPMAFPAFVPFVLWLCDKLEHALTVSLIILVPKILGGHYSLKVNRFFIFKKRSTW